MKESVILLDAKYKGPLGSIRNVAGWQVAANGADIWLRGPLENGKAQTALSSLLAEAYYLVDEKNRLFTVGKQTPVRVLEPMQWQNLHDFFPVEMPVSAMPGRTPDKIELKLSRSNTGREAYALLVGLSDWIAYAETAPKIRLQALMFAVCENNEVLLTGNPLPFIKGKNYWLNKNILIPSGFDFDPPITTDLIPLKLNARAEELILFDTHAGWQRVPLAAFAAANRATTRLMKTH